MELRRNRHLLMTALLLLCGGLALCRFRPELTFGNVAAGLVAAAALTFAAVGLWLGLRPWRFRIGPDGLALRLGRLHRTLAWHEIDAVVLHLPVPDLGDSSQARSPQLLLIPAAGVDLGRPADVPSPVDGRPGVPLLDLSDVKDTADEVAAALSAAAGRRFTDHRALQRDAFAKAGFTIVLRGYDEATVDRLCRDASEALLSESAVLRTRLAAELRAKPLPIVMRGYERAQVDAHLRELAARLAVLPGADESA